MAYTPAYYNQSYGWNNAGIPYMNSQSPAMNYGGAPQAMSSAQNTVQSVIWVDGEIGAKAYQMPPGMTGPVALWDTNDQLIYWKSMNQMGMPNPLIKMRYQVEDQPQMLPGGQSGDAGNSSMLDHDKYVTKDDFQAMRNEIASLREMLSQKNSGQNQNGRQSGNGMNRGGSNNG